MTAIKDKLTIQKTGDNRDIYLLVHIHRRYLQAEKSQRSVKHIWFLPTLKANAEKPKELALSQPTTRQ
jgi:hypothetical protein